MSAATAANGWIAAILLLLITGGIIAYFLLKPDQVRVPDVIGDTETQATLALQNAGFEVDPDPVQNDAALDTVIESDPRPRTEAEEGSTVTITVSLGPGTVEIPEVVGLKLADAKAALKEAGFDSLVQRQPSDSVNKGIVISSDPSEGLATEPGETVTLVASSGVATETVPSVVGKSRSAARGELERAGFVVNEEPMDSDEPEDQVLSQDPAGNSEAKVDSTVTIVYSSGVGTVSLDDFVGQKATFAERKLENAGIVVDLIDQDVNEESQDGIVLSQAPGAGAKLSPGDRVTLTIGEYTEPDPVEPPDESTTTPDDNP